VTKAEILAKSDSLLRKTLLKMYPELSVKIYSSARKFFIELLSQETKFPPFIPPEKEKIKLWDLNFNCSLFNAAGMFKKGEAYYTVASQGAGAYIAGTTTGLYRRGNEKLNIMHPFMPYPKSFSASNWMGLPNEGHEKVTKKLSGISKISGCPLGISVSTDPGMEEEKALKLLIEGLILYEKANVDFIELNESCPNVPHGSCELDDAGLDKNLIRRLEIISDRFLTKRKRNLPVIIKLSNDTDSKLIDTILNYLIEFGFDGINLGNTSLDYQLFQQLASTEDLSNFDYFSKNFGGGLSGRILKDKSLNLCTIAAKHIEGLELSKEFHIIRTGGIESYQDLMQSNKAGVSLNQWFTGYFEMFSKYGHKVYQRLFSAK
jgi:dihydroorotate dehydrogenase